MLANVIQAILPFFIFFAFMVFVRSFINKAGSKNKKTMEMFLNEEREANFARRHDIEDTYFYHADISLLPVREYPCDDKYKKATKTRDSVVTRSNTTMLRLTPPLTNLEIKQKYGATNLESITMYEENYEQYIRILSNWAEELIKVDEYADAEVPLLLAVDMESQIFKPYALLVELYLKTNNKHKLIQLQNRINGIGIVKDNTILSNKINDLMNDTLNKF